MKKILFVSHSLSTFTTPIIASLQKLKFQIKLFDYGRPTLQGRVFGLLGNHKILDKKRAKILVEEQVNHGLLSLVDNYKPDYLFVFKGKNITPLTLTRIKKKGIITINYFPDYMEDFVWIKKHVSDYDFFFNPCEIVVNKLKQLKIKSYYLPFGYNPDKKIIKVIKKYDLAFVGQYTKRREKYFSALTNLDFHIWGYQKYWQETKLFKHFHKEASFEKTKEIIRSAKIVVNVLTCEDKIPIKSVNYRVFETEGLGTFLLNWYHEPINEFYKDGVEIVNFKTPKDLLAKAKYYLVNESKREEIAFNGWRRTVKEHTWKKRLTNMFKIIDV